MLSRDVIAVPGAPACCACNKLPQRRRLAQPWPALVLALSNAEGRQLGMRRFLPRDYLGNAPKDALLAPARPCNWRSTSSNRQRAWSPSTSASSDAPHDFARRQDIFDECVGALRGANISR